MIFFRYSSRQKFFSSRLLVMVILSVILPINNGCASGEDVNSKNTLPSSIDSTGNNSSVAHSTPETAFNLSQIKKRESLLQNLSAQQLEYYRQPFDLDGNEQVKQERDERRKLRDQSSNEQSRRERPERGEREERNRERR